VVTNFSETPRRQDIVSIDSYVFYVEKNNWRTLRKFRCKHAKTFHLLDNICY